MWTTLKTLYFFTQSLPRIGKKWYDMRLVMVLSIFFAPLDMLHLCLSYIIIITSFAYSDCPRSGSCGVKSDPANNLFTSILDLSFSSESVWQHPDKLHPLYNGFWRPYNKNQVKNWPLPSLLATYHIKHLHCNLKHEGKKAHPNTLPFHQANALTRLLSIHILIVSKELWGLIDVRAFLEDRASNLLEEEWFC